METRIRKLWSMLYGNWNELISNDRSRCVLCGKFNDNNAMHEVHLGGCPRIEYLSTMYGVKSRVDEYGCHHFNGAELVEENGSCWCNTLKEYWEDPDIIPFSIDREQFAEKLPHGSGIDCDWRIEVLQDEDGKEVVLASNTYHAINSIGMYCCEVPFTATYKDGDLIDLSITPIPCDTEINGGTSCSFGLEDYLWDTLS